MGKRSKKDIAFADDGTPLPEFKIVVEHNNGRGPIAPYRFVIVCAIAMAVAGIPLWETLQQGGDVDMAMLRFGGVGLFGWLVLGKIDKILASAPPPPRTAVDGDEAS